MERFVKGSQIDHDLDSIAASIPHFRDSISTASKARAVYLNKPEGTMLWHSLNESTALSLIKARAVLLNH
jgi:hypothetical protein